MLPHTITRNDKLRATLRANSTSPEGEALLGALRGGRDDLEPYARRCVDELRERDWAGDDATEVSLKAVQADTLIVGGADDVVLPRQNSDALAGLIAGARLWMVASAGHAMMY